jgi:hypothetical protein
MITYKITLIGMQMNNLVNPPSIVSSLFPEVEPISIELSSIDCTVTFDTPQTPTDLGPLVKVEIVPNL